MNFKRVFFLLLPVMILSACVRDFANGIYSCLMKTVCTRRAVSSLKMKNQMRMKSLTIRLV